MVSKESIEESDKSSSLKRKSAFVKSKLYLPESLASIVRNKFAKIKNKNHQNILKIF